jgi:hypothetical protein
MYPADTAASYVVPRGVHLMKFVHDLGIIVPPLNQTLWMLLVASLTAGVALCALHVLGTTGRKPDHKSKK